MFGDPVCPKCGGKLERTYYAFPYPQWRCRACMIRANEKRKEEKRIKSLEERIAKLEGEHHDSSV